MRSFILLVGAALSALIVGCGGKPGQAGGGRGGFPPMPVETAAVTASGMTDAFTAIGSLDAEYEIEVVAELAARVVDLPFREGQRLEAGDPIANLDDAQLQAELQRAEALVQQRRATFQRVRSVVNQQAGAAQDLDDAAAALAVAEAELAMVHVQLDKTRITAPFAGVIGARQVSPGAYLQPGMVIADLAQIDRLRVVFGAPESYVGRIRTGAAVHVRTSGFDGLDLAGTVDVIDPVLDRASRSAEIVAHIDNPERQLRPGMSAEVTVTLASRPDALTVPAEAVFFQGQQAFVYTVAADSTVALAPVSLGSRGAELVEVTAGLGQGQTVVRAGHQKLFPGAKVMPLPAGSAEGATP
ncbi:MAG: efflux RND transporter periplasmic adaptor subunit [Candidatus Krumholzibacteriia bacterium]